LFADHPHAGGENETIVSIRRPHDGPSPRGWGELLCDGGRQANVRTIPTRVGRTFLSRRRSATGTDHPHAGGENREGQRPPHSLAGPSPRGWGELAFGTDITGI